MIVVETSTSNLRSQKSTTTCSSTCSPQLAVRDGDARLRHELGELRRDPLDRLPTRLCTKKTWPSRSSSRRIAAATCLSEYGPTKVRIGCRSSGGVASVDISRMPVTAISSVRGIGRRTHREDVDVGLQLLERVLVLDAEALLLVDDDEAEVFER